MSEIVVRRAVEVDDVSVVRRLMWGYGDYLASNPAGAANICLERYEQELAGLPGEYAVLLLAWVDGGFRGLGLGRRLVDEAIRWAERTGYAAMYLDTVPAAMPEANRLYEAMGFQRVERYNKNPISDVVFFRLGLEGEDG
jgi:GNAT superfamily N-acetyltransferase